MRSINLEVNYDGTFRRTPYLRQGETGTSTIYLTLPTEFQGYKYVLVFQPVTGNPISTEELTPDENQIISYVLTAVFTAEIGTIGVELTCYDESDNLVKSAEMSIEVKESLSGAGDVIPTDYVPWYVLAAQKSSEAEEDAAQTALDRVATGEDVVATGEDVVQTSEDRAQTGQDRIATGQDRVATGEDRSAVNSALSTFSTTTLPAAVAEVEAEGDAQILLVQGEGTTQKNLVTGEGTTQVNRVIAEGDTQEQRVTTEGTTQVGLVQAEGITQIGLVEAEGDAQILLVQGEGTTQIGLVQAEGVTQVGIVEDEGDAQVSIVQQAGANLQSIIDNAQIGSLDDLHTNEKSTLVGSINEIYEMQIPSAKRYGVRWDKTNAACTRLYDAAAITTVTTNFGHFGSVNASYNNPFDSIYPWRDRKLCNVDLSLYYTNYTSGNTNILDSVISWESDPDFSLTGGTGIFVGVYTPEFWAKTDESISYVDYIVADMPIAGYTKFPATIGARWHGVAEGTGINSKVGMPVTAETMSAMHARATAMALTLDDIWSYSATSLLASVEYATLNHQTAIGKGVDGVYVEGIRPYVEETAVNRVVMTDAQAANFFTGVIIDIGTSNGGRQIANRIVTSVEDYPADSAYAIVNFDGAAINTLSAHYVSAHGVSNLETPEILSTSGYIGTNGKSNAFYRGQVHHANLWRYCLGAYREKLTSKIWTSVDPAGAAAVDALNTGVHRDTGLVLPTGAAGIALSGYLGGLHQSEIPLAPFGSAAGGTDANPVGDYLYVPALTTGNTVLLVGGNTHYGALSGRFIGIWNCSATASNWSNGALPFLKT